MSPRLRISNCVIERLFNVKPEVTNGCLYGVMYDGILLVVGFTLELSNTPDQETHKQLQLNFPTEVELCGVVRFSVTPSTELNTRSILQDVDVTDNPLVLTLDGENKLKAHFLIHDKLEEADYENVPEKEMFKQFIHINLLAAIPLCCEATTNGVRDAMLYKRRKIASGQVSFNFPGTNVYLFDAESATGVSGVTVDSTISDFVDGTNPEPTKKKKGSFPEKILPVNIVFKTTKDVSSEKLIINALKMVTTQGKTNFTIKVPLILDTLVMVSRTTRLVNLYTALVEAACKSLRLVERSLLEQLGQEGIGDGAGLQIPETFHYLPQGFGHFFTRVIPKNIPDPLTVDERKFLHQSLGLPLDKPVFRRTNAYIVKKNANKKYLINPHEWITSPHKEDAVLGLVRGRYSYHHYMQDNFDDDGWGCAYRSLQTLCSWLRFQGYTDQHIPSHREIQECLVSIRDKPSSFLGSKQWIGSTEVSFCLESLLNIQSRILFANNAADLLTYTSEIMHHFKRHGSPIMIGGGVLAHTILGIEYNSNTEETRYLILDPHYTGVDDISVVISKGWCAWKNSDFWSKTAHYNLCMPQTVPCI